jgi:class 3 adenylate cyclase/tetratricopeptide (TPR) repeat protein
MRCSSCGAELIPGKPFCHACGAPAVIACTQCGRALQPGFRFCPDCGTEIGSPALEAKSPANDHLAARVPPEVARRILAVGGQMAGERKRVTVLFCDLVGSTAIAENLDPEVYHELLEKYLALAFREIYHYDGFVNQMAGDGLMALFGAPIAHEDAPHRAVRAALAIRESLAELNRARRDQGEVELQIRIGINTGPVLVGAIGNDLKMDYTAIGDTTNVAARLQSLAQPGSILLSDNTHRLVRGFFAVREAGKLEMKGKSEPVAAFEVLGLNEDTTPIAVAAARGLTPFVGRDEELSQLLACFDRLGGYLAQVVTIVGEAGSGKSRLIYELRRQLADRDVTILDASCSSLTQMQPNAPWASMVRQFFGISVRDDDVLAAAKLGEGLARIDDGLEAIRPYLGLMIGMRLGELAEGGADEVRRAIFGAMSKLLAALTRRAPTIMLIEDLHWIDDASREMLELAVNRVDRQRLMILVSHRPDYQPAWRSRAAFTQIHLQPLPEECIDEIARSVAGGPLPEQLAALVRVKAEGNPFFAEEIARIVVEEGYVVCREGRFELTRPISELRMPGTVEEVLGARLDRLGLPAKRTAQVAAVLGRQFRRSQLVQLLEGEGVDVAAQVDELEARGIFHRKTILSDDEYRFGESLTQEVAYEGLLLKERRQLHERVAQMLEAEAPSPQRSILIAHHLARSSNHEGAVRALLQAALEAERLPSYPTAMKLYRKAWDAAIAIPDAGGHETAMAPLAVEAANGLVRISVVYGTGDDPEIERAASRGAELAESLGDIDRVAALTTYRGFMVMSSGRERFHSGLELVEKGLGIAQRAGLEQTALSVARGLAIGYLYDGRFAEAKRTIEGVLRGLLLAGPDVERTDLYMGTRFMANSIYFSADEFDLVEAEALDTYARAKAIPNRTTTAGMGALLAWLYWLRGDSGVAIRWAEESLEIAEGIGNGAGIRTAAMVLLAARLARGERGGTGRYVEKIEQGLVASGDMASKALVAVDALVAAGEVKRARRFAETAYQNAGGRYREAVAVVGLADAIRAHGDSQADQARGFYKHGRALAEKIGSRSTAAAAALGLAALARNQGRDEEAGREARCAIELASALGLQLYVRRAETLLE